MNWSGTRLALKAMGTREGMMFNSSVFLCMEDELTRESGQPGKLIVSRKGMRIVFSVLL